MYHKLRKVKFNLGGVGGGGGGGHVYLISYGNDIVRIRDSDIILSLRAFCSRIAWHGASIVYACCGFFVVPRLFL